jgi:hypothetical protein
MLKLNKKIKGMKVLMVDGTSTNLNILEHILKLSGLDIPGTRHEKNTGNGKYEYTTGPVIIEN